MAPHYQSLCCSHISFMEWFGENPSVDDKVVLEGMYIHISRYFLQIRTALRQFVRCRFQRILSHGGHVTKIHFT
jgi:hypothetical protein